MTLDYPRIRAKAHCPLCSAPKTEGALVCWPCFRKHDMRRTTSPDVAERLDTYETLLEYDYGRNFDS